MTLLIRNVQILGSDQKLPDNLDLFVSGDKIAALGRFPEKKADKIIDGQGAILAPGFIDVHSESDHYLSLFTNPGQDDFLLQGVTTSIGGLCGGSLAPLIYGGLESLEEWTDIKQTNVDWHTVKEFLKVLDKKPLGVNFGTLIGHNTIRQALIGKVPRNLTKNELGVFSETLKHGLEEGGFGLSTGLGYAQNRETPYAELKLLAGIVKNLGGIYATHLRKEGKELNESIDETIRLAEETKVKSMISHFIPEEGNEENYEKALGRIEALPDELNFHVSLYPLTTRILKLYTFLPSWAQKDDVNVMNMSLKDEWLRKKIEKDLPEVNANKFIIAQAPNNPPLVGFSLSDIRKLYSLKSTRDALLKLMTITNLQATIFYQNINEDLIKKALKSSKSLVASNAASFKENASVKILKPERATSTFTKFLSLVQKENLMPLEKAIEKITKVPAQKFNLPGRGVIKEGYIADLVGLKNECVSFVVLNGRVVAEEGKTNGICAGKILRHKA